MIGLLDASPLLAAGHILRLQPYWVFADIVMSTLKLVIPEILFETDSVNFT